MSNKAVTPFEKRVRHAVRTLVGKASEDGMHRDSIVTTIATQYKVFPHDIRRAIDALERLDVIQRVGMGNRYAPVVRS